MSTGGLYEKGFVFDWSTNMGKSNWCGAVQGSWVDY